MSIFEALSISARASDNNGELPFFEHYCRLLASSSISRDQRFAVLGRIELPSATGTWRHAGEICTLDGVKPQYQVHPSIKAVLGGVAHASSPDMEQLDDVRPEAAPHTGAAGEELREYFSPFIAAQVPHQALGMLVALLGRGVDDEIQGLAEHWLGSFQTVENLRQEIWLGAREASHLAYDTFHGLLENVSVAVRVLQDGATIQVPSVLGSPMMAEVGGAATPRTLVIHAPSPPSDPNVHHPPPQWLELRAFDPRGHEPRELLGIIRNSVDDIFTTLTRRTPGAGLDRLWRHLDIAGQVQVEVVRRSIRRELPAQLRLLGFKSTSAVARRLAESARKVERAQQALDELDLALESDTAVEGDRAYRRADLQKNLDDSRLALQKLIEGDPEVQLFLLERVTERLRDSQYDIERVVLELFQNADDATAQMREMRLADGQSLPAEARKFTVKEDVDDAQMHIRVMHWGRGINRYHVGTGFKEGRERGYDRDLMHMMLLHASDKGDQKNATGKFGLGFKSVYLVCDCPRVQSDRLAFEVHAGFLPSPRDLSEEWTALAVDGLLPTVVDLPLNRDERVQRLLKPLRQHGGLLAVFGRAIDTIEFHRAGETPRTVRWSPQKLKVECAHEVELELGDLRISMDKTAVPHQLLVIHKQRGSDERLSFTMALSGGMISDLPDSVPTIWCTAPTEIRWNTGWCLNGPFAVDIGRSQLGTTQHHVQHNQHQFQAAGRAICDALTALDDLGWSRLSQQLRLAVTSSDDGEARYLFWSSVWHRLGARLDDKGEEEPSQQIIELSRSWIRLYRKKALLPTSLAGAWRCLTHQETVTHVASPVLARTEIAETVSGWIWARSTVTSGSVVHPDVASVIRRILPGWKPKTLELIRLAESGFGPDQACEPGMLTELLPLRSWLDDGWWRERKGRPLPLESKQELTDFARALKYKATSGRAAGAEMLLMPALPAETEEQVVALGGSRAKDDLRLASDEHRIAVFAPEHRKLSSDYLEHPDSVLMFLESRRDQRRLETKHIATWASEATTHQAQVAVVDYLVHGARRDELLDQLREDLPSFIDSKEKLVGSGLLGHLAREEQVQLAEALFPKWKEDDGYDLDAWHRDRAVQNNEPAKVKPQDLELILDWWLSSDARPHDVEFHQESWPTKWEAPALRAALVDDDLNDESIEAWMTLLLLGSYRSLGRSSAKKHRSFLETLSENDVLDVFLKHPDLHGELWLDALRGWEDAACDRPAYQSWWQYYPVAHQLRRFIEVYRRILLRVGHPQHGAGTLKSRVVPRSSDIYNQAGRQFEAPFLPLGLGTHWVIRELCRIDAIPPGTASPFAWTPDAELRGVAKALGLPLDETDGHELNAQRIHEFMTEKLGAQRCTMNNAFCVPLRIIARSGDLRAELGLAASIDEAEPSDNPWT